MSTNSQPLVSVLTPVYNGGLYLRECIESVLRQTHSNWDYTIINNGSNGIFIETHAYRATITQGIAIGFNTISGNDGNGIEISDRVSATQLSDSISIASATNSANWTISKL